MKIKIEVSKKKKMFQKIINESFRGKIIDCIKNNNYMHR